VGSSAFSCRPAMSAARRTAARPERPPNIFARGRAIQPAPLDGSQTDDSRARETTAGIFSSTAAGAAVALPMLSPGGARGRKRGWPPLGRPQLAVAAALMVGAIGSATAIAELGPPDERAADAPPQSSPSLPPPADRGDGGLERREGGIRSRPPRHATRRGRRDEYRARPDTYRGQPAQRPKPSTGRSPHAAPQPAPPTAPAPSAPEAPPPDPIAPANPPSPSPPPRRPLPAPVAPGSPPQFM
jgi:hypothetical protein